MNLSLAFSMGFMTSSDLGRGELNFKFCRAQSWLVVHLCGGSSGLTEFCSPLPLIVLAKDKPQGFDLSPWCCSDSSLCTDQAGFTPTLPDQAWL